MFDDPGEDPLALLCGLLDDAVERGVDLAHAMVLATTTADGAPRTRTVAVKRWDRRGVVFGTRYDSRKARQLHRDARAAGTFQWPATLQQINLSGRVEQTSDEESDALFAERSDADRATAIASRQSEPLDDEVTLISAVDTLVDSGRAATRPPTWGGYRLVPDLVEFWQGRRDGLHRRLEYRREGDAWRWTRLQP